MLTGSAAPQCSASQITPEDGGKDLFVHHSGINGQGFRTLAEGAKVSYEAEAGPKGPNATNVTLI